ncbi:MAG TPA: hydrogenase iron-sulfur subunit [Roseiflexaceae bacterium]|nr:hydrogenase iron-sulfur subunit [Roseiflexaceae bacterium]
MTNLVLDAWYLEFLPLSARYGGPLVWGVAALALAALLALPWLARGRHLGPAVIADAQCTGYALCAQECPYGAIEMQPRTDGARYETIAVINPDLCTGCGICVETCSTVGVNLAALTAAAVQQRVGRAVEQARQDGPAPVTIFACQRHAALGTLPGGVSAGDAAVLAAPAYEAVAGEELPPAVSCAVPCVGMVQPEWVREALGSGSRAVVMLSCHCDDCAFREGPRWTASRLGRRQKLARQGVHILEAAPGDRAALMRFLARITGGAAQAAPAEEDRPAAPSRLRLLAGGAAGTLVLLLLTLLVSLPTERRATAAAPERAVVRVALAHPGQPVASEGSFGGLQNTPTGVSAAQVLSGERHPVRLRLEIDGRQVAEREYLPGGLRRDGTAYGLESWDVPPGRHTVRLWIMDDGAAWRLAFDGPLDVAAGRVAILSYNKQREVFTLAGDRR